MYVCMYPLAIRIQRDAVNLESNELALAMSEAKVEHLHTVHTYIHTCIHTVYTVHTYIHTYMHACMHGP
jgi:hypothetical protein